MLGNIKRGIKSGRKFSNAVIGAAGLALLVTVATSAPSLAQDKTFLPSGHVYTPDSQRVPHPNSPRSRIESQADVYETEIYRRQHEERVRQERFRLFINNDFYRSGRSYADY